VTTHDIITAGLAAFAAIAGFLIEWRRIGNDANRVAELSAHVASLEARLSIVEARHDRMDRAR
jgi:orotate phosphoribosyltransferase-like protein